MAALISSGTSYAASSDFTVVAGVPNSLFIHFTGSGQGISYQLQHKDAGGAYKTVATLTPQNIEQLGTIYGVGVFRVIRDPGANASSMDKE
jgi:hypothetical protein